MERPDDSLVLEPAAGGEEDQPQPGLALPHLLGTHDDPQPEAMPFEEISDTNLVTLLEAHLGQGGTSLLLRTNSSNCSVHSRH